jgi:hypothetical protein
VVEGFARDDVSGPVGRKEKSILDDGLVFVETWQSVLNTRSGKLVDSMAALWVLPPSLLVVRSS